MFTALLRSYTASLRQSLTSAQRYVAASPFLPPRTVPKAIPNVSKVLVVASGKGGVGKSMTAVNLAVTLASQLRMKVGLLDADVFGPSIPLMMKLQGMQPQLTSTTPAHLLPLENHAVKCMSMGFLADAGQAVVWRGPMVGKCLDQMLFDTIWGDLDVLMIDLPPGTGVTRMFYEYGPLTNSGGVRQIDEYGDTHISLVQRVIVDGALIVTTPQEIALSDVSRSIQMFQKVKIPLLGVIENMSFFQCSCGQKSHIFGDSGGRRIADEYGIPLMGQIPLEPLAMTGGDKGAPIVLTHPESQIAKEYVKIANALQPHYSPSA